MKEPNNTPGSPGQQIRNLLFVIVGGVACAFLAAGLLLYNYGPSGKYLAGNALLSPELTEILRYPDTNAKTGATARFVFDRIEFSYYNDKEKQQSRAPIDRITYRKFYEMVANDQSVAEVPKEVALLFADRRNSSLVLKVHPEGQNASTTDAAQIFQVVDFVNEGDYFRIELRDTGSSTPWAYFYHPQIHQKVMQLFVPNL